MFSQLKKPTTTYKINLLKKKYLCTFIKNTNFNQTKDMETESASYTAENLSHNPVGLTPTDEFATLRTHGYSVEFKDTLNIAWNLVKSHLGQLISYTFLCLFSYLTLSFITPQVVNFLGQLGYLVGTIVNLTLISALLAGFYSYFEKNYQKERVSFQNLFDGFNHTGQLALYQIVVFIILLIPFLIVFFLAQEFEINKTVDIFDTNTYETFTVVFYFIFAIPSFLVFTLYIFTPILIVIAKMNFWSAMELSRKIVIANFIGILGFVLAFSLLNLVGLLFLGLGLIITLPLSFAATFILYTKLIEKNGGGTNFGGDFYTDENAPLDAF